VFDGWIERQLIDTFKRLFGAIADKSIIELNISNNKLNKGSIEIIANYLKSINTLKKLALNDNLIDSVTQINKIIGRNWSFM